jgi:glycosyltransferase involved in cell wall biosynthesis
MSDIGQVCLAMMVKNEEKTVLKSLNSCKHVVTHVKIYDTGSTDDTLNIIQQFKTENPNIDVQVIEGEFVDFATSRNVLLDFVDLDLNIKFALLLDSNDELQGHDEFNAFVKGESEKTRENSQYYCSGYLLRQKWFSGGSIDTYFNVRFIRVRHGWRYKSPVHEYIASTTENENISIRVENPAINLYQDRTNDCESSFKRFSRDKDILLKEHLKNPEDSRTCFYLAQTYGSLGMHNEAYYFYKLRLDLGGYDEEIYHSYQRLGEIAHTLNMDSSVSIGWWTKALEHTRRVEPAVKIATYYLENNIKFYLAAAYTNMAIQMDFPTHCNLFINRMDYDYTRYHLDGRAQYYVGNYKQGMDSCKKAIEYTENIVNPLTESIRVMVNEYIQYMMNLNPKNMNNILNCVALAQTGNLQRIHKFCTLLDDTDVSFVDVSLEYIEDAKRGDIKKTMENCQSLVNYLQTEIKEGGGESDVQKKCQHLQECIDKLTNLAIYSLQCLVKTDSITNQMMKNIGIQTNQKNMYITKLNVDKTNLEYYVAKLEEIKKQKKMDEIDNLLKDVEQELDKQTQAQQAQQARTQAQQQGKKKKKKTR